MRKIELVEPPPEITVERPAAQQKPAPKDPPLTVVHLLIWIAGCALYLGVMRILLEPQQLAAGAGYLILRSASAGAGLGGLLLLPARRWRHTTFPRHPGEWILLAVGARFVLEVLTAALPLNANPALTAAVNACVLLPGALFLRGSHVWRAAFCLMVLAYALPPLADFSATLARWNLPAGWWQPYVAWIRTLVLMALLASAIAWDGRSGTRRPWSHWVGLAAWCWEGAISLRI